MTPSDTPTRIAVIGAGVAGSSCASSLQRAGMQVTVFDKSRGAGGRMATRRSQWIEPDGLSVSTEFDHGAACFTAHHPRFRAVLDRAQAVGSVARWRARVHAAWTAPLSRETFVAVPTMSALCGHLLDGATRLFGHSVQRLQRDADGWHVVVQGVGAVGPFDQVMVAVPAPQAALLLAGHQDDWADALAAVATEPCWSLMAVTDEVDWPWDAAELPSGPLEWVLRNDRKPGREALPGRATWVAHASPAWSRQHLEDEPQAVTRLLGAALAEVLPQGARAPGWHHAAAHRWRHALPIGPAAGSGECWWDPALGVGVCGDCAGGVTVESAWRSGDELADTVLATVEALV